MTHFIKEVGKENVVQVIIDNSHVSKVVGMITYLVFR